MEYIYIVILILVVIISVYLLKRGGLFEGFDPIDTFDLYDLPTVKRNTNPSEYTAIIIEPRKHRALEFVLQNFVENLDERWNFIIFHGNMNEQFVQNIVDNKLAKYKQRITLSNLGVDNMSVSQYSELFYNPAFYDNIPTEMFLVFQTDTIILKENRDNIYKFMDFDYVGSPWNSKLSPWILANNVSMVGNGGLSLRRKSKMVENLKYSDNCLDTDRRQTYGKFIAEDQCFNGGFSPEVKMRLPTVEDAMQFGTESIYSDKAFGVHKPWAHKKINNYSELIRKFPEISILESLN
jgi:hypothetical protein